MHTTTHTRNKTLDMIYVGIFVILIAICSWISIPTLVPFTLQTFGIFLTFILLGGKRGTMTIIIYILLGIIGIPVFSGFRGGIGVLFGTTGGYILGFLLSGLFMWKMELFYSKKPWILALSMFIGLLLCYTFGTVWFMVVYAKHTGMIGLGSVLSWCVIPFIIPDLIKLTLAFTLRKRFSRFILETDKTPPL